MVKRKIIFAAQYKKDYKRVKKRHLDMRKLAFLIKRLEENTLMAQDKDHTLKGEYNTYRECHVSGDWVLVYRILDQETVELYRTGTHQDIFKKRY